MKLRKGAFTGGAFDASRVFIEAAADMLPAAILFDLDDTLFDHRHASAIALAAMHAAHAPDLPFEAFAIRHAEVLERFHQRFLAGELSLDDARVARMQTLFARFDRPLDAATAGRAASLYREHHQANRRLVAGARELLEVLGDHCRLGIVTNNRTLEQTEKLRALNISGYFDTVVISEDVGVIKPDPRIFAIALERIGAQPREAVFIGDSWDNDIGGALSAGMAAVWFNRDDETPALERVSGQNAVTSLANAGVSYSRLKTITSLTPTAAVITAVKTAFANRTHGAKEHEQLATLAPRT